MVYNQLSEILLNELIFVAQSKGKFCEYTKNFERASGRHIYSLIITAQKFSIIDGTKKSVDHYSVLLNCQATQEDCIFALFRAVQCTHDPLLRQKTEFYTFECPSAVKQIDLLVNQMGSLGKENSIPMVLQKLFIFKLNSLKEFQVNPNPNPNKELQAAYATIKRLSEAFLANRAELERLRFGGKVGNFRKFFANCKFPLPKECNFLLEFFRPNCHIKFEQLIQAIKNLKEPQPLFVDPVVETKKESVQKVEQISMELDNDDNNHEFWLNQSQGEWFPACALSPALEDIGGFYYD